MLDLSRPITAIPTIIAHLRNGGAIDLRTPTDHVWILGRAPSGAEFDLFWWSGHGYAVTRCVADDQPMQRVGVFPAWAEAVDQALQV